MFAVNVKDYTKPSDISLPTSCTTGQKWIRPIGAYGRCGVYTCGGPTVPKKKITCNNSPATRLANFHPTEKIHSYNSTVSWME